METNELIECITKLKNHCKKSECGNCKLNNLGTCFAKNNKSDLAPSFWEIPIILLELSYDEKYILKMLSEDYNWIAKNEKGELYAFYDKPFKINLFGYETYISDGFRGQEKFDFPELLKGTKWNGEPLNIQELLEVE